MEKNAEQINYNELSAEQLYAKIYFVIKKLEWKIQAISDNELNALSGNGTLFIARFGSSCMKLEWTKNESAENDKSLFFRTFEEVSDSVTVHELAAAHGEIENTMENNRITEQENQGKTNFSKLLIPTKGYIVTPVLLYVNVFIFILMAFSGVNAFTPDSQSLVNWGADFKPLTLSGECWRVFTCCFIHIGIIHLAMNMYALLDVGQMLERRIGSLNFLIAYISAGVLSSFASLFWNDDIVSAGASGAIFGMYGFYLALLTSKIIEPTERTSQLKNMAIFIGYNLIFGLKGNIDNAAHIGGLISGMLLGYAYLPMLIKRENRQLPKIISGGVFIGTIAISLLAYTTIPNPLGVYDRNIPQFTKLEEEALEVYRLPENSSTEKIRSSLTNGKKNWVKCLELLNELDELKLVPELKNKIKDMKEYTVFRRNSYELNLKSINENTEIYNDSIIYYDKSIEDIINKLNAAPH